MPVHVAIGAPYSPARAEEMGNQAACLVLTCDDPDLATEVFGSDEMEALAAGLEFLEFFLLNLTKGGGQLLKEDGTSFDPAGSILLRESRRLAIRSAGPASSG